MSTKSSISINKSVLEVIEKHALTTFPNECAGFFYGKSEGSEKLVFEAMPIENYKEGDQRRRFEVDPLDYMRAEKHALKNNTELLGIYHSHPLHPAIPSEHDRKQAVPFFSYIIVSVRKGEILETTSWLLNDEQQFEQEKFLIGKEKIVN